MTSLLVSATLDEKPEVEVSPVRSRGASSDRCCRETVEPSELGLDAHRNPRLAGLFYLSHEGVTGRSVDLDALIGDFDEARDLIARARRLLVKRIRARRPLMFAAGSSASVEILADDLAAGERELQTALQMALDMREREWVSQLAASLSRILSIQSSEEAEKFSALSYETAPADNVAAQAL